MQEFINTPIAQYGAAGFCMVLLAIIVWLIKQLLCVIERSNQINAELGKALTQNTAAVRSLYESMEKEATVQAEAHKGQMEAIYRLRDQVLRRGLAVDD